LGKHPDRLFGSKDFKLGKGSSVLINNKVAEAQVRSFLNRKIKSKRERYRSEVNSNNSLPLVNPNQIDDKLYEEMKLNLPSHYCYFHVSEILHKPNYFSKVYHLN
jgi:hypothetical protein